ncbi:MAG: hypothetical protein KC593_20940 [Myxococcales bacterium]|nr:hypothetical protein [Myxococcales bacterium]
MLGPRERALLERLEDENTLESAFRAAVGSERTGAPEAFSLPPRAAGLLTVMRQTSTGAEAVARAQTGDPSALRALLDAPADAARTPRLLHHLALFHGSAAETAQSEASRTGDQRAYERVAELELRAVASWALLLSERHYLTALAEGVADGALSASDVRDALDAAAFGRLRAIGQRLLDGVQERTTGARHALQLLDALRTRPLPAAVSEEVAARVVGESARLLRRALDAALASLTERFAQAEATPDGSAAEQAVLADAAQLYTWSDGDWYVALFALERATTTGWTLYKAKRWDALAQLGESLRALVDGAATRVEQDPQALPYASLVAQMLVFRAEMGKTLATRILDGERALRLCDIHRNARVILADLLAERATATLDGTGVLGRDAAVAAARADLTRAAALWPGLPRVANLQKRIDQLTGAQR